MRVSVEFAAVLAQVMPGFLVLAMFEQFLTSRVGKRSGYLARITGVFMRYLSVTLCFLVLALSLIIVAFDTPYEGPLSLTIYVPLALLGLILWVTIMVWSTTLRQRALEDGDGEEDAAHSPQRRDD